MSPELGKAGGDTGALGSILEVQGESITPITKAILDGVPHLAIFHPLGAGPGPAHCLGQDPTAVVNSGRWAWGSTF
jgi:hypothetical protein